MDILRIFRASALRRFRRAIASRVHRRAFRQLLAEPLEDRSLLATIFVNDNAPGPAHDGMSWATAYTDLQQALTDADTGDEIWVAAGEYKPTAGADRTISFNLKSGVSLYGGFVGWETSRSQRIDWSANVTTLSGEIGAAGNGDNSYHVVYATGVNNVTLNGFTVNGGNANGGSLPHDRGGGIYIDNSPGASLTSLHVYGNNATYGGGLNSRGTTLNVTGVTFYGNHASLGGGMVSGGNPGTSSLVTLTDVEFKLNSADEGGGYYINYAPQPAQLTGVTFRGNGAINGGGLYSYGSDPRLIDVTFVLNQATDNGGGMFNHHSDPVLRQVTFQENTAGAYGGGIYSAGVTETSHATLINVLFDSNSANRGGAMVNDHSSPVLMNITLANNQTNAYGAAIHNYYGSPTVTNSILWNTLGPGMVEIYDGSGSHTTVSYSTVQGGWAGTGNSASDPKFVNAAGGDFHLLPGSPAIDAGTSVNAPSVDLDGRTRPQDGNADGSALTDMGAFEYLKDAVWYVNHAATGARNTGASWTNAFLGLQEALAAADAGDEIWVADGTYKPGTYHNGWFALKSGVDIYGGFVGEGPDADVRDWLTNVTTLSGDWLGNDVPDNPDVNRGDNSYHVVVADHVSDTTLDGFVVTGGNAKGEPSLGYYYGGGMVSFDSSPTVRNVVFTGNSASWAGGGMATLGGSPTLTNVVFRGNRSDGPGIWDGVGGGLYSGASSLPRLTNVTFSNNWGRWRGGAIYSASTVFLANATLVGNSALDGGGIYGNVVLANGIVWGNSGPQLVGSVAVSYSIVQGGWAGSGNINQNPLFVDVAGGNLRLQGASPAINAGNSAAVPPDAADLDGDADTAEPTPLDLDLLPRIAGPSVDMGAYEFPAFSTPPVANPDSVTVDEDSGENSIDVLANDTSAPDTGEPLLVIAAGTAEHGTVSLTDGVIRYAPAANYYGSDSFTYTLRHGALTATGTVSVMVTPVNDPPVANPDSATVVEDSGENGIDVLANDTSAPDTGETLSVIAVGAAEHGTVSQVDGVVRYAPAANYYGSDSFTYTVSDGNLPATGTVQLTVTNVPDVPVANPDSATVSEDSGENEIKVLANDTDADDLTPPPNGGLSIVAIGPTSHGWTYRWGTSIYYKPTTANYYGPDSFTYTISDGTSTSTTTVSVTIINVPDAPVANTDYATVSEDSTATVIDVLANDADADNLTGPANAGLSVIWISNANHGAVRVVSGVVQYTPAANYYGTDWFIYDISDGLHTDTAIVYVNVNNVADAPVANPDSATVSEDSTASVINVLANDTDVDNRSGPANAGLSVVAVGPAGNGTVTLVGGVVQYTPAANFYGTDSFTYTVTDSSSLSATGTVNVTVTNVDDAPVAQDDSATVSEDSGPNLIDVLANDADADNLSGPVNAGLEVTSAGSAAHGTVSFVPSGVTYTPNPNYYGSDSFTYTVSDGTSTATGTVNVTIANVNDAPVAVNDSAAMSEDSADNLINVLANDMDADNLSPTPANYGLTVTAVGSASHGTVSLVGGQVRYTPAANYYGDDSFSYTISDGNSTSTGIVNVTAMNVADAPVAVDDSATVDEDSGENAIEVLANDSDADNLTPPANAGLTVTAVGNASHGTVSLLGSVVSYSPHADYYGSDSFTYTISDLTGLTSTATVMIVVGGINEGPVARDDAFTTYEDSSVSGNVLDNDTDVDGDALSVTAVNGIAGAIGQPVATAHGSVTLHADGSFTYAPGAGGEATSDSFTYTISDGQGGTATATVTIAIQHYAGVVLMDGILCVGGTPEADVIAVDGESLIVNGVPHSLDGVSEVRIWGRDGNDQIDLAGLAVNSFVHGGQGNDVLTGGSAHDVIFGGYGEDTIAGAAGHDFLIGGAGRDRIVGSSGNDILVAGDVADELSLDLLRDISRAWAESHTAPEAEDEGVLDEAIIDTEYDSLTGSSGADLFLINSGDKITDFKLGKPGTNNDGDEVRYVE